MSDPAGARPTRRSFAPAVPLLGTLLALVLVVAQGYLAGGLALAGTCWATAALRLLLPTERVGSLAVRSTRVDVAVLATMGLVVAVLTTSVPTP